MSDLRQTIAVIGVSPRNSYYRQESIAFAIATVVREFGRAHIFVPDFLDRHNYIAYGYEEKTAKDKARSLGDGLKKAVREICAARNWDCADSGSSAAQVRILGCDEKIEINPVYREKLGRISCLYEENNAFRQDIRIATQTSIESRMRCNSGTRNRINRMGVESSIDRGVHYILGEFSFLESVPGILGDGREIYFYHQPWAVFQNYIAGKYDGCARPELSFGVINRETGEVSLPRP